MQMKTLKHWCAVGTGITLVTLMAVTSSWAAGYHVIKTYKVGGEGGWDYLTFDKASNRLFISRSTHVIVMDADSGKVVGDIPDTPGVHGIALAPEFGRGFISNGRENTVSVFELSSLKVLSKIKVGENPDAILYDPASKRIFTFNGHSHDVRRSMRQRVLCWEPSKWMASPSLR
jgi:DNA-binding beta-propeller fold protein YncE